MSEELLRQAFVEGFKQSGEGFNAEYPFAFDSDEIEGVLDESFTEWYEESVVEFDCKDCGEHVVRPRNEDVDIAGLTPVRCGSCTLDRMAE